MRSKRKYNSPRKDRFHSIVIKKAAKETRLLKDTNFRKSLDKPAARAGELEINKLGKVKSFIVNIDGTPENKSALLELFEYMNDLRAEIVNEIKEQWDADTKKGFSFDKVIKTYCLRWKASGSSNAYQLRSAIYNHCNDILSRRPIECKYHIPVLARCIELDLEGKLNSYIKLSQGTTIDEQSKNLFVDWKNNEDEDIALNLGIVKSVLEDNSYPKITIKKFKSELLKKALDTLGEENFKTQDFEFDVNTGKVKKIVGEQGIKQFNILCKQLNIYIGQYNGQLVNAHLILLSDRYGKAFKNKRDLFVWKSTQPKNIECEIESLWNEAISSRLPKCSIIKGIAGFPTFKTVQEIKNKKNIDLTYIKIFKEIYSDLSKKPFDEERFIKYFNQDKAQVLMNTKKKVLAFHYLARQKKD